MTHWQPDGFLEKRTNDQTERMAGRTAHTPGASDQPVAAMAALNGPRTTLGKKISSCNAYKPTSIRRMLLTFAAEVRQTKRYANKASKVSQMA
ncbi:hypothetical protein HH212_26975 (plasmid) [Massilia forsythiae]|uniref:Uncharacterized protein n=1 Tax=Massilia forsythiae TaxID=2728020 RepID=A0A7Z2W2P4_9BURK|nr:hypothetical protein [Massilia forsythiae]QJE03741.1 hypothetical protein HH212_26975 [Massilia forsythiae]